MFAESKNTFLYKQFDYAVLHTGYTARLISMPIQHIVDEIAEEGTYLYLERDDDEVPAPSAHLVAIGDGEVTKLYGLADDLRDAEECIRGLSGYILLKNVTFSLILTLIHTLETGSEFSYCAFMTPHMISSIIQDTMKDGQQVLYVKVDTESG